MLTPMKKQAISAVLALALMSGCAGAPTDKDNTACSSLASDMRDGADPYDVMVGTALQARTDAEDQPLRDALETLLRGERADWNDNLDRVALRCLELKEERGWKKL